MPLSIRMTRGALSMVDDNVRTGIIGGLEPGNKWENALTRLGWRSKWERRPPSVFDEINLGELFMLPLGHVR